MVGSKIKLAWLRSSACAHTTTARLRSDLVLLRRWRADALAWAREETAPEWRARAIASARRNHAIALTFAAALRQRDATLETAR